jgi:hypothetical protein
MLSGLKLFVLFFLLETTAGEAMLNFGVERLRGGLQRRTPPKYRELFQPRLRRELITRFEKNHTCHGLKLHMQISLSLEPKHRCTPPPTEKKQKERKFSSLTIHLQPRSERVTQSAPVSFSCQPFLQSEVRLPFLSMPRSKQGYCGYKNPAGGPSPRCSSFDQR